MKHRMILAAVLVVWTIVCSSCSLLKDETGTTAVALGAKIETIDIRSDAVGKEMKAQVFLPPGYSRANRYPVLYLLHGKGGNERTWNKDMDVSDKAASLIEDKRIKPLLIVMPDYDNSYGTNYADRTYTKNGRQYGRYEDYLTKELIAAIDSKYSTVASPEGRSIGGVSMGGFTALFLAFTHQDLFSKAGGHSPAMFLDDTETLNWLFKDEDMRRRTDPLYLADTLDLSKLSIYLDYGDHDMDHVIDSTDELYAKLKKAGVNAQLHVTPGGHDAAHWRASTEDYLIFYAGMNQENR